MQPSIPVSIPITSQIKPLLEGKTIRDIKCETYYKGDYQLPTISFNNTDKIIGYKIIKADSNFIYTDNGICAEFGGEIPRYYKENTDIKIPEKILKTGGFIVKFIFNDSSCLAMKLNSWVCRFKIRTADDPDQYPFIRKYPLDICDKSDFNLVNFKQWLSEHKKASITEACVSVKGAFDMSISLMMYIFLISSVHPKTKIDKLSDDEIIKIYDNTKTVIDEYKSGIRCCEYIGLFGEKHEANENNILLNSNMMNVPCPLCGSPIDAVSGVGTKLYYCPSCQVLK